VTGSAVERDHRLGYRPALDGIRAVAITLVVLGHIAFFLVPASNGHFFRSGFLGVDLFFVLSGFLITTLLLERHGREPHPIGRFYARRGLRLVPALAALLTVNLIVAIAFSGSVGNALRSFAVAFTYTTNWAELDNITISKYVLHFWSLAIEGQFYLVWPLAIFGMLRLGLTRREMVVVVLAVGVAIACWRASLWWSGHQWLRLYLRTDVRADSLLVGAVLALLPYDALVARVRPTVRSIVGLCGLLVFVAAAQGLKQWSDVLYVGGFTGLAVVGAVVIAMVLLPGSALYAALASAPAVFLGRISYSLYLWHFPVFWVVADNTKSWTPAARVLVAVPAAVLIATASYRFVERPALRLKRRLGQRRPAKRVEPEPASVRVCSCSASRSSRRRALRYASGSCST
jgi:peptidoglycan/LPS O-acetylase OafA/YrhL